LFHYLFFGVDAPTAVSKKSAVFWDVRPCSPIKFIDVSVELANPIFREEVKAKQEIGKKQQKAGSKRSSCPLLVGKLLPDYMALCPKRLVLIT
jgi:hypothetical protein